ncbi:MAG: peptide deformylase [Polyangia bacterium]|nr:peptide deformylase [Polyangia bacterium]
MTEHFPKGPTRRELLIGLGAGGLVSLIPGCAPRALSQRERFLIFRAASPLAIVRWARHRPDPRSVLRERARPGRSMSPEALRRLDARMRETLASSGGVGLAAPQVGVSRRVILVQLQDKEKRVLTLVDPLLRPLSAGTEDGYEACLSVDGVGGLVRRTSQVEVRYFDLQGRAMGRTSSGWEARIFQHEVDHLDGVLYLDRLIGPLLPIDEVRRRRAKARAGTWQELDAPHSERGERPSPDLAAIPARSYDNLQGLWL